MNNQKTNVLSVEQNDSLINFIGKSAMNSIDVINTAPSEFYSSSHVPFEKVLLILKHSTTHNYFSITICIEHSGSQLLTWSGGQ